MKRCCRCGQTKPTSQFGRDRSRPDGLEPRCSDCRREVNHRDYTRNRDGILERHAEWRERNPDYQADYQRTHVPEFRGYNEQWAARHPERTATMRTAYLLVAQALRDGVLVKTERCEDCGATGRIESAHADYERPLDVRWLCVRCHRQWDRLQPKTGGV